MGTGSFAATNSTNFNVPPVVTEPAYNYAGEGAEEVRS